MTERDEASDHSPAHIVTMGFRTRLADILGSLIIILTHPVHGESFFGLSSRHTETWTSPLAITRLIDYTSARTRRPLEHRHPRLDILTGPHGRALSTRRSLAGW
jgi:hypothetical protein